MKKLRELLHNVVVKKTQGEEDIVVADICFDSRKVGKGSVYVAQRGTVADGHDFIDSAIEKGAVAVVCETLPQRIDACVCYVKVENTSLALGQIAAAFYGEPSKKLHLVGITGTNGKTSIATLLYELFTNLGYNVGLLSTIKNYIGKKEYKATHTTPDALKINELLCEMVSGGCEYCFMEVSSHSLAQHRVAGLQFEGAIFTNITHDHLDYHKTFAAYLKTKKSFFDTLGSGSFALTNLDDKNGLVMLQNTKAVTHTYSVKSLSNFKVKITERHFDATLMEFDGTEVWTKFIGDFNAYNLLAVYATACLLGMKKERILLEISQLKPVSGRMDTFTSASGITTVVDYAHTPDALLNVLTTLRGVVEYGKIITVVGAGGNRDKTKRPEMAEIACRMSEMLILTSDNPRDEKPEDIISEMYAGVPQGKRKSTLCIADRREAIHQAAGLAAHGDVILIAGKGHETYQEVCGVRTHFDDKEEITKILK